MCKCTYKLREIGTKSTKMRERLHYKGKKSSPPITGGELFFIVVTPVDAV